MTSSNQSYIALKKQIYSKEEYRICPIRYTDRFDIMKWRNEQIYHLRQSKPLTEQDQEDYFNKTVNSLFNLDQPDQILFSFLKNDSCIGYGGLVHINWIDKNAEISFIMKTSLEDDYFDKNWTVFLALIEELAFCELSFHKLYVYAFDLRPHLYKVLVRNGYFQDARLKEHCLFDGSFVDVVIHSKIA